MAYIDRRVSALPRAGPQIGIAEALRRLARLPGVAALWDGLRREVWLTAQPVDEVTIHPGADAFAWLHGACRDDAVPGWIGTLSYEAGRSLERLDGLVLEEEPRLRAARYQGAVVLGTGGCTMVGPPAVTARLADALWTPLSLHERGRLGGSADRELVRDLDDEEYRARFDIVHEAIAAGDLYQLNLTTALRSGWSGHPLAFFERLVGGTPDLETTPGWAAYLDQGDRVVASASPELLLDYDPSRRRVISGPIKGTTRRGVDEEEDASLARALAEDEKERAEHLMIVDLVRSDLGRVCRPGTVRPRTLFEPLRTEHLQHLVTYVEGDVRDGLHSLDVLRALYPAGSITGAPKVAAMQLIDRLEVSARGVYCGAIGRFGPTMKLALPIRTATLSRRDPDSWEVVFGAGGGLVADSECGKELAELELKASRLRIALSTERG